MIENKWQFQFEISELPATELKSAIDNNAERDETLAARGDMDDFIQLYQHHLKPVHNYLYARLGNRQDAEDVTAIVFERAWTSLKNYKPNGSFRGWLFTIVHRALADYYRQHKSARNQLVQVEALAETLFDPSAGPEEMALLSERLRQVREAITSLNQEQREVVYLRFVADLHYKEVAQVTGKRESAVKMIAYRALEEIRRRCSDVQK